MHRRLEMELLLDAIIDTVKLMPFLYVVYVAITYFEGHSDNKIYQKLGSSKWGGPIVGALLGCVPQCGFSAVGANLYSKKMIGLGTLMAIFISTSDEAIPILLAHPQMIHMVAIVLGLKVLFAIIIGIGIEGVLYLMRGSKAATLTNGMTITEADLVEEGCGCGCSHSNRREDNECAKEQGKASNIWLIALKHTIRIIVFIFFVNLVLNVVIEGIGEDFLKSILLTDSAFQPALAALIGLIPNCAASIILTEMFVAGNLSLGSLIAGLSTGAGVGLVVLFKTNKNIMDNLKILGILYIMGTLCGVLIQFIR